MRRYDYLIIGGGIAGTTAAETIRRNDAKGTIAIVSEEPEPLYSRLTLHYYLKDKIPWDRLYLRNSDFYKGQKIDLKKGLKAVRLDVSDRSVILDNGESLKFSKLLIATGGYPNSWHVSGSEKKGIFYFRTLADAKNIKERIQEIKDSNPNAVVIGGGFIGLDLSTSFVEQKLKTQILILEDYFWQGKVDKEQGKLIEDTLRKNGVCVLTDEETEKVLGDSEVEAIKTKSGKILKAGIVGVGIGIHFDLGWLSKAGIAVNRGVLTNEYLETNITGIFAAGDIAEFWDILFERRNQMGNWINAQEQGKVAGLNMVGQKIAFETVSFYTADFFDGQVSFIGITDVKEATLTVTRGSGKDGSIGRLFLKDDRLIGATLINRAREQGAIIKLIKNRNNLKGLNGRLRDPSFDLQTLL